jgi:uncharacterized OB-fold protein
VTGPNHDEFWAYCDSGELRIQRCGACEHLTWPPSADCERCGGSELEWELMSGRGSVVSWCTFEQRYYAELDVPYDTILVELDEGPLFTSNPHGFTNDDLTLGDRVEVAFIECEDDAGAFHLPVFEPDSQADRPRWGAGSRQSWTAIDRHSPRGL